MVHGTCWRARTWKMTPTRYSHDRALLSSNICTTYLRGTPFYADDVRSRFASFSHLSHLLVAKVVDHFESHGDGPDVLTPDYRPLMATFNILNHSTWSPQRLSATFLLQFLLQRFNAWQTLKQCIEVRRSHFPLVFPISYHVSSHYKVEQIISFIFSPVHVLLIGRSSLHVCRGRYLVRKEERNYDPCNTRTTPFRTHTKITSIFIYNRIYCQIQQCLVRRFRRQWHHNYSWASSCFTPISQQHSKL